MLYFKHTEIFQVAFSVIYRDKVTFSIHIFINMINLNTHISNLNYLNMYNDVIRKHFGEKDIIIVCSDNN